MVDADRLIRPSEDPNDAFPGLGFSNDFSLETLGEQVLMVDPIYLADVYNSMDSIAMYLRVHGLFLMDFGGDASATVLSEDQYVVVPLSRHYIDADLQPTQGRKVLFEEIGCDSGSFLFMPMVSNLPKKLREAIKKEAAEGNAAILSLAAGRWIAFYEQFTPEPSWPESFYRDIVLKRE